jgi:hypothetical protein
MIQEVLHEMFQVHYIHEILHLMSGCIGSFFGTWACLRMMQRREKKQSS